MLELKVTNLAKTIRNLINNENNNNHIKSWAGFYEIPCSDSNKKYVGESSRSHNK